jgi:hypothetical protein
MMPEYEIFYSALSSIDVNPMSLHASVTVLIRGKALRLSLPVSMHSSIKISLHETQKYRYIYQKLIRLK